MLTDVRRGQRSRAELVILRKAEQVFANTRKARRWLSASNLLLDGVPLLLIGSREGRRRVYDELVRIEFNDFA